MVTLSLLLAAMPVPQVVTRPAAAEVAPESEPTEERAVSAARKFGQPVRVESMTGALTETKALPDGRLEQVIHAAPVRTFKGGKYVPIDTRLQRSADGGWEPATGPNVVFSSGGSGPFARMAQAGKELSLTWPYGNLPTPTVSGNQATYAEVLEGVDLIVSATRDGFSHVLVVKTPQAARLPELADLRFTLGDRGLEVAATGSGALKAEDSGGAGVVFEAEPAVMWDSSGAEAVPQASPAPSAGESTGEPADEGASSVVGSSVEAPGEGAEVADLRVSVVGDELRLEPDEAMLTDPDTTFPVYIDPAWHQKTAGQHRMVSSVDPTGNTWFTSDEGLGYCHSSGVNMASCGSGLKKRLLYQFPIAALDGQNILFAEFKAWETKAYDGTSRAVRLYRTKTISDATTWNNTNSWSFFYDHLQTKSANYGGGSVDPNWLVFDGAGVRSAVQNAADEGVDKIAFGLMADNESDYHFWKRFRWDAQLRVLYNLPPRQPPTQNLKTLSQGQVTECVGPDDDLPRIVGKPQTLRVNSLPDPNGDLRQAEFQIGWNDGSGFAWRLGTNGNLLSNKASSPPWELDVSNLNIPADTRIRWRVRGHDFKVNDNGNPTSEWQGTGPWSDRREVEGMPIWPPGFACNLIWDSQSPRTPNLDSTDYPRDQWRDGVGKSGAFRITNPGVEPLAKYQYKFVHADGSTPVTDLNCANWADCSFTWSPTRYGSWELQVWAIDQAGRSSGVAKYSFRVRQKVAEKAWWTLDQSGTTMADRTGLNPATIVGPDALPAQVGRIDKALRLNLTPDNPDRGHATTAGPLLDPGKSYTVSAWVKLTEGGTPYMSVVSQDGQQGPAFRLQYRQENGSPRWAMSVFKQDVGTPADIRAVSKDAPRVGQWTHLVGVHDAAARKVSLYVDGELQQTASYTETDLQFPRAGGGPFTIGRTKWDGVNANYLVGLVDDVHIFDDSMTINADYVRDRLFRPTVAARWRLDTTTGTSPVTSPDDETPLQNAQLHGGAQVRTGAAACDGSVVGSGCLSLDGVDDHLRTSSPIMRTDQSFTVAGWAFLPNQMPQTTMTAFAQTGTSNSAFTVRWNHRAGGCRQEETPEGDMTEVCVGRWEIEMPDQDAAPTEPRARATSRFSRRVRDDVRPDHLVLVYDAMSDQMSLYVNGVIEDTASNVARAQVPSSFYSTSGEFLIGAVKKNGTQGEYFSGLIDDVWVYRGALDVGRDGAIDTAFITKLFLESDIGVREGEPDAHFTG